MRSIWTSIPTLLLLPTAISAITLDCSHIRVDDQSFNLKKLGGPKTVHRLRWEKPSIENTTFTLDICSPLTRPKDSNKDEECAHGTRVCAKEWDYPSGANGKGYVKRVIPIAGEYSASNGRGMEPKYTRLKNSAGNNEGKEGVTVELHGGKYPNERSGTPQKAIIEFLCDREVTGNEGFKKDEQAKAIDATEFGRMGKRQEGDAETDLLKSAKDDDDDDDEPKLPDPDEYKNLKFLSYKMEGDIEVLRLRWKTKFACEGAASKPDDSDKPKKNPSSGWGFFTWFIIVLFLLVASYIIFGSWLNYNRYGARGWDLIPHGDTIRDIPYIMKDWGSNFAAKLKGGDTRGGYSAV